jgi:hypothetical protein
LLVQIAAACVYLLVDEVDVVEVPDPVQVTLTPASYVPIPVNGVPFPVVAEILKQERKGRA